MIPLDKLRPGLLSLAEICHVKLDVVTERLWQQATREITEAQWKHGVDVTLRTWKSTWMPPPGVVIDAAYTAPLPTRRELPIRSGESVWASEEERMHVEQIVRDNPREAEESVVQYAVRIAGLAGLMAQPAAVTAQETAAREPGEDG